MRDYREINGTYGYYHIGGCFYEVWGYEKGGTKKYMVVKTDFDTKREYYSGEYIYKHGKVKFVSFDTFVKARAYLEARAERLR